MKDVKKKIAFIAPASWWWPSILYTWLVKLLCKKIPQYEYHIVSSKKERIQLHFINHKYDIIISSIPFLRKPPHCKYIIHQHWLYKIDRWFKNIPQLLARLYPYNALFSTITVFPSEFLKKHYNLNHKDQRIVANISNFWSQNKQYTWLDNKKTINVLSITWFAFYKKAIGVIDIIQKLKDRKIDKEINFLICGDGKYLNKIKKKCEMYQMPSNINITFLWKIDQKDLVEIYQKTDIFLYSTFQETFGISILDAMAFGIPTILNNYGLFYELYDHEFIADNKEDFTNKLNKLIYDVEYLKYYCKTTQDNFHKFNTNTVISQRENIFKSLS